MEKQFYRRNLPHWQINEATYFVTYRLYASIPRPVIEQLKADYRAALEAGQKAAVTDFCIQHGLPNTHEVRAGDIANGIIRTNLRDIASEQTSGVLLLEPELRQQLNRLANKRAYNEQKRYFGHFDDLLDQSLNEPHWLHQPDIAQINADALHFYHEKLFKLHAFCIMSNHIHALFEALPDAPPLEIIMQRLKRYTGTKSNRSLGRQGHFWEAESYDHLVRQGEFERILTYILNNPVKAKLVTNWQEWRWTYCA